VLFVVLRFAQDSLHSVFGNPAVLNLLRDYSLLLSFIREQPRLKDPWLCALTSQ
jgi:hypothetical protein